MSLNFSLPNLIVVSGLLSINKHIFFQEKFFFKVNWNVCLRNRILIFLILAFSTEVNNLHKLHKSIGEILKMVFHVREVKKWFSFIFHVREVRKMVFYVGEVKKKWFSMSAVVAMVNNMDHPRVQCQLSLCKYLPR